MIIEPSALVFGIGGRGDDEQAEEASPRPTLPEDGGHFFIADLASLATIEDSADFPGGGLIVADLLGGELFGCIKAPRTLGSAETQHRVFARAGDEFDAGWNISEDGAVAETAVAGDDQEL